ncbi:hypothetical protein ACK1KB_12860 [Chryseobacterium sp. TY3]
MKPEIYLWWVWEAPLSGFPNRFFMKRLTPYICYRKSEKTYESNSSFEIEMSSGFFKRKRGR